jgi:hypothetical protein
VFVGLLGLTIIALSCYYRYERSQRRSAVEGSSYASQLTVVRDKLRNDLPGQRVAAGHSFEVVIEETFGAEPHKYKRASIISEPSCEILRVSYNNGEYLEATLSANFTERVCARADLIHGTDYHNTCVVRTHSSSGVPYEVSRPLLSKEKSLLREIHDAILVSRSKMPTQAIAV